MNAAALFSQTNPEWPLADFLAHAALEAGEHGAKPGEDAVQLMTVHAAKGLEFHSRLLVGLEESLFPHENALSEHSGLEEERRLLYVALTRARQQLFLSHAQARFLHGQMRYPRCARVLWMIFLPIFYKPLGLHVHRLHHTCHTPQLMVGLLGKRLNISIWLWQHCTNRTWTKCKNSRQFCATRAKMARPAVCVDHPKTNK